MGTRGFVTRFLHFWRGSIMPAAGAHPSVGLAVSAGRDSCALAVMLARFRKTLGIRKLVLLHLDHGLRPPAERARDLRVLKSLSRSLRLPLVFSKTRVGRKKNVEAAGRAARIAFFAGAVRRRRLTCVATAHHLDDRIETFFMFLLRGSGSRGLSSLRAVETLRVPPEVRFVRPFLPFDREEIRQFAETEGVEFHEDSTNTDRRFLRNALRLDLMPILEKQHPRFRKALAAAIDALEQEDAALSDLAASSLNALTASARESHNGRHLLCLNRLELSRYPEALLVRILQQADRRAGGSGLLGGHTNLTAAARAIQNGARRATRVLTLPAGRRLWIEKDQVKLETA